MPSRHFVLRAPALLFWLGLVGCGFAGAFLLSACTNDAYDTGDSRYSYLRTDFVEARTDGRARLVSATTDGGGALSFPRPVTVAWAAKADTAYRALLYYNLPSAASDTAVSPLAVEPVSMVQVYVLRPRAASDTVAVSTDPVHFLSAWRSANGSYVNLSLALMTGVADSIDARQSIGLVCDSVTERGNGRHTYYYTFLHSQGGVPQYYKSTVYVSIDTKKMTAGDRVRLSLNTYEGIVVREFAL